MKFTAWKSVFNIVEVPIIFTDRSLGSSKMSGRIFIEAMLAVWRLRLG
jgi:dolichol-phosphate mannosyltransferase